MLKPQTIKIEIPLEIVMLCDVFDATPEGLLTTFMRDLASMKYNQGSDERSMAKDWFLRGAISSSDWISDYDDARAIVEDFESMYSRNYPSIDNTQYDKERKMQLKNWYAEVNDRKKYLKKSKAVK
jgi:hypothetical protein